MIAVFDCCREKIDASKWRGGTGEGDNLDVEAMFHLFNLEAGSSV